MREELPKKALWLDFKICPAMPGDEFLFSPAFLPSLEVFLFFAFMGVHVRLVFLLSLADV
jgi:hypothetical protein